jgi:hypothetical protein
MAFKNMDREISFADLILKDCMGKNRCLKRLSDISGSKVRYIVEQYFGISHLHDRAKRARFTTISKNKVDCWYRQVHPVKFENHLTGAAFNIARGLKIMLVANV